MKDKESIAVKDLAELAVCEQQAVFNRRLGKRIPHSRRQAMQRGQEIHRKRDEELSSTAKPQAPDTPASTSQGPASDRRCFLASEVYGPDAWQTERLRGFRDQVLNRSRAGRYLVAIYYRVSPPMARYLARHPGGQRPIRLLLDSLVDRLGTSVGDRNRS